MDRTTLLDEITYATNSPDGRVTWDFECRRFFAGVDDQDQASVFIRWTIRSGLRFYRRLALLDPLDTRSLGILAAKDGFHPEYEGKEAFSNSKEYFGLNRSRAYDLVTNAKTQLAELLLKDFCRQALIREFLSGEQPVVDRFILSVKVDEQMRFNSMSLHLQGVTVESEVSSIDFLTRSNFCRNVVAIQKSSGITSKILNRDEISGLRILSSDSDSELETTFTRRSRTDLEELPPLRSVLIPAVFRTGVLRLDFSNLSPELRDKTTAYMVKFRDQDLTCPTASIKSAEMYRTDKGYQANFIDTPDPREVRGCLLLDSSLGPKELISAMSDCLRETRLTMDMRKNLHLPRNLAA